MLKRVGVNINQMGTRLWKWMSCFFLYGKNKSVTTFKRTSDEVRKNE